MLYDVVQVNTYFWEMFVIVINIVITFADLTRSHHQLLTWIKQGLGPKPNAEPILGKGNLETIWLGGVMNPGALVSALRHERAASEGCALDQVGTNLVDGSYLFSTSNFLHVEFGFLLGIQVELRCVVVKDKHSLDDEEEFGLILQGLHLEGATWDKKQQCLVEPRFV